MTESSVDLETLNKEAKKPATLKLHVASGIEALKQVNENRAGWAINLYRGAGEASGSFRDSSRRTTIPRHGEGANKARSQEEASQRAKRQIRRYCAHNRLNRLGTLTFAEACNDQLELRLYLGDFFRELRKLVGRDFPYVWVPEWHPLGHGLHVHFAVGRFIKHSTISAAWGRGHVGIQILGDLPTGSQDLDQARLAAGYISKYVAKSFADPRHIEGLHRYDIAQGFKPDVLRIFAPRLQEALSIAVDRMGSPYDYYWDSNQEMNWNRPPAVYLSW